MGEQMIVPCALTIAGSDSGGGAGIQADLKTFAALGVYGMSAVTALTAQNTEGVLGVVETDPDFVALQMRAVMNDIGVDAVKTGMLVNSDIIGRVASELRFYGVQLLVVDPVMIAKSGDPLLQDDAVETLADSLLPLALVVTPNLHEASRLAGMEVSGLDGMKKAAKAISKMGPRYVVVKGGHLDDSPLDLLYDGENFREYGDVRYENPHTHGTGCTFASAIAAGLAWGDSVEDAVGRARSYISGAIREGLAIGKGRGPVHHFHELYRCAGMGF
jgi:hydroxymethylpyrimidine/phosphomethylpyrimidine kinase